MCSTVCHPLTLLTTSLAMSIVLPTVSLCGTREEMGRAHGLALADLIRQFVPMRFAAFERYAQESGGPNEQLSIDDLRAAGSASIAFLQRWHPAGYREHCAIAAAAGVDAVDLFTAGNMTDMRDVAMLSGSGAPPQADTEGCSAVLVPGDLSASGQLVCGQTWDLNPDDVHYVVAFHRKPDDGLETWSISVCGCPTLVGMNSSGLTVGTTNVKTWGARPGVGYMNLLHRMIEEKTAQDAISIVEQAPRSGAHVYWACDADEGIEVEAAPSQAVRRALTGGPIIRTNHCLQPELIPSQWQPPSSSSVARLTRLQRSVAAGDVTIDKIIAMFADRSDGVDSVCRYEEDEQGTATDACMIAVPQERTLLACRGPADRGEWRRLQFDTEMP